MKIIALIPTKNEEWVLQTCISSIKDIVDDIVILDDDSSDDTVNIAKKNSCHVYFNNHSRDYYFREYEVRKKLLNIGRNLGGTHFLFLDADEAISSDLKASLQTIAQKMKVGEKLFLRWIPLWKSVNSYREDNFGTFKCLHKDILFYDDKISDYTYTFVGVSRTPGKTSLKKSIYLEKKDENKTKIS